MDTRVHCCLYFIPPYGHGLRQIDLEFLKRLQYKVNLIPVIAKADTLTKEEVQKLKQNINKEIEDNDIEIYQFPDCDSDEDEEFKGQNQALKSSIPFAVVSGTHSMEIAGRKVRGRQYPWGFVEVDNPKHSDFALLRRFVFWRKIFYLSLVILSIFVFCHFGHFCHFGYFGHVGYFGHFCRFLSTCHFLSFFVN